jgi:hypothetical protein
MTRSRVLRYARELREHAKDRQSQDMATLALLRPEAFLEHRDWYLDLAAACRYARMSLDGTARAMQRKSALDALDPRS